MLNQDIILEKSVVNALISKGLHISCAESCTGGMLAARIVNVANASSVLNASFVTYAPEAKSTYAGVNPDTIATYGIVSEKVAGEMAGGVALQAGAEVGIGITGLAGPSGGTDELPVGTVCFGFSVCGKIFTRKVHFSGSRNEVRYQATEYALQTLLTLLK